MKRSFFVTLGLIISRYSAFGAVPRDSEEFSIALKRAEEIADGFARHPANNHPFFKTLEEEVDKGLTPQQFEFIWKNYGYRTAGTFISVMNQAIHEAKKGNFEFLPYVMTNAGEEGGSIDKEGNIIPAHMGACQDAFNTLGKTIYGQDPIEVAKIDESEVLPEVLEFRRKQEAASKAPGEIITGRFLGHENAASGMLRAFEKIFIAQKGNFNEEQYNIMVQYFRFHIPESETEFGIEDRHGKDAILVTAAALYKNLNTVVEEQILEGGKEMLDAQETLWNAMKLRLEELGRDKDHERIPPKKGPFLNSKDDIEIGKRRSGMEVFNDGSSEKFSPNSVPTSKERTFLPEVKTLSGNPVIPSKESQSLGK